MNRFSSYKDVLDYSEGNYYPNKPVPSENDKKFETFKNELISYFNSHIKFYENELNQKIYKDLVDDLKELSSKHGILLKKTESIVSALLPTININSDLDVFYQAFEFENID